jgi:soluble lytic murein transglycosylase-like protein
MRLLAALMLFASIPAQAAVWEIDDAGAMVRLDTPPVAAVAPVATPSRTSASSRARARQFQPVVTSAGAQYALSPALIDAIAHVESRYNPDAVSRASARGIMQLMPGTARDLGVDARDPAANIRGGTAYLRQMLDRFDGDVVRAIAAYNAGPGAVARAGGVPRYAETRAYVAAVLDRLAAGAQ